MEELEERLNWAIQEQQKTLWSNWLITINSNVVPRSIAQRIGMTQWLRDGITQLFGDFNLLNGLILKPAGSPNDERVGLDGNTIIGVRTALGVEQAPQTKLMHGHILLEVSHLAVGLNAWGKTGVHLNVTGLREWFDANIHQMPVMNSQKPKHVYVQVKLLTTGTDNSNKWLTLAYIDKDRDIHGRNLKRDRQQAPEDLRRIRQKILDEADEVEI